MDKYEVMSLEDYDLNTIMNLYGINDEHIAMIENALKVKLTTENNVLYCDNNEKSSEAGKILEKMLGLIKSKHALNKEDVNDILNSDLTQSFFHRNIAGGVGGRKFYLRTKGQKELYEAFENHDITFAIGPAGTGKTFLAVCYAVSMLRKSKIRKIILTRPVVEAGESLGFLPGDLKEKVDPYLRPIYDCLEMLMGHDTTEKLIEKNVIEIAPLAYMRGRTLNDAVVILDEAQNTTEMQIKMFLTRLGFNSKMIITGDITQVDLPKNKQSGLVQAAKICSSIEEIAIINLGQKDVVRHPVVSKIIDAYENN